MSELLTFLVGLNVALFLWFLYEITRLEGWPGRKWHHAFLSVPLVVGSFYVVWWLAIVMLLVAGFFTYDDAAQHRVHNRLKREGKPMSEWPTSRLHRLYESVARSITD